MPGKRVLVLLFASAAVFAQDTPRFEVASVRPIPPGPDGRQAHFFQARPGNLTANISGNRITIRIITLSGLIMDAFNVRPDQFTGVPAWATDTDVYEISAKTEGDAAPAPDQVRLMLQALLNDRFQLRLRHETRSLTVYELTIAKSGLKVKLFPDRTAEHRDPWSAISLLIGFFLDYPIVDKTGLTGFFPGDAPKWDNAELNEELKQGKPAPSIFHETEAAFGLTLKKATEPSEFLVIERLEHLSPN